MSSFNQGITNIAKSNGWTFLSDYNLFKLCFSRDIYGLHLDLNFFTETFHTLEIDIRPKFENVTKPPPPHPPKNTTTTTNKPTRRHAFGHRLLEY